MEKIPKHYFKILIFAQKQKMKKKAIFDQNHELTFWKIRKNATTWSEYFYRLETILFY